jgi:ferrochelatase
MSKSYDAILVVSFGGPEGRDDVIPFLENVLRGKPVPRERMLEVAEHYYHFDGVSPINEQNRALIAALKQELSEHGPKLPIYWGNRNWHPLLLDTLKQMRADGIKRAIAFFTSAFSSYSGCRQYRENIEQAQSEAGENVPQVDKLRAFFNHPGFIESMQDRVKAALDQIATDHHAKTQIVFTAHSIPIAMANGCEYVAQLEEACRLVAEQFPHLTWKLVYQSRSGPPSQPWLEPDVCDYLKELHEAGETTDVIVSPIGFISDHMEVLFDLDTEARELCSQLGLNMVRAATVGTHPKFIAMIRELIIERLEVRERRAVGNLPPWPDVCPEGCCLSGRSMQAGSRPSSHGS